VSLEDFDQALVFALGGLQVFQFVTAGAEGAAGGVLERFNGAFAFFAGIDQLFSECADDAVPAGINLADDIFVFPGGFDDAGSGSIDDGGDTAGLSIESVFTRHVRPLDSICVHSSEGDHETHPVLSDDDREKAASSCKRQGAGWIRVQRQYSAHDAMYDVRGEGVHRMTTPVLVLQP